MQPMVKLPKQLQATNENVTTVNSEFIASIEGFSSLSWAFVFLNTISKHSDDNWKTNCVSAMCFVLILDQQS